MLGRRSHVTFVFVVYVSCVCVLDARFPGWGGVVDSAEAGHETAGVWRTRRINKTFE